MTLKDITGKAKIKNAFGDTNMRIRKWPDDNKWEVESVSGKIHAAMSKDVADNVKLSASTRCGSISYGLWRSYPNFSHNSTEKYIYVRSVPFSEAVDLTSSSQRGEAVDLTLLTQSGDIVLETVQQ